ncbi:MAG: hypothetical protein ACRDSP_21515 [Pseudonocardiaceae bacterium]
MQRNQPTGKARLAPLGPVLLRVRRYRHIDRLIADWDTTPGKLRVARIILVIGVLLAGGVGLSAAISRNSAIYDITHRIAPLNTDVTTLYRSLADANATVTSAYLASGVPPTKLQQGYDQYVNTAASSLADAGALGGQDEVTATGITGIDAELPRYTGLVERARANNRRGLPVGVAYLRRASELMQTSILPEAEQLQQEQASRLDAAYLRAGSIPVIALTSGAVSLAGLIWAQVFLFRRTHRVFNIGLVAATGAVLIGLLWWTAAVAMSAGYLKSSSGHSRSVSEALGPAQIVALKARAIESLALVSHNGAASEPDFDAKMQLLARHDKTDRPDDIGGALGAARKFALPDQRPILDKAIREAHDYSIAHTQVRKLDDEGEYGSAIHAAIDAKPGSSATAFTALDNTLATAVTQEQAAFDSDIGRAEDWLTGLTYGTGGLAVAAAVGVALGIRQRLEDYR